MSTTERVSPDAGRPSRSVGCRPDWISPEEWGDWRWHMRHRIQTLSQLERWIDVSPDEVTAIGRSAGIYRWSITPYFASQMDPEDVNCPVRQQAVPSLAEFEPDPDADIDPVGDRHYRKTNRVVHKYGDRALLLITRVCPVYCRHCTRKHHTTEIGGTYFGEGEANSFEEDFAYLEATPEIRDVLLTGGDPLSYLDSQLEPILARLRQIPHVEIIRIGSRFPVLLPQRITPALCQMLEKYHPFWLNTHFNHPNEVTPEAAAACDRLLRHGIPVQNQSVLLRGVNDDLPTMRKLLTRLLEIRVRPYYLYHCDNVRGVSHFTTTIAAGQEIVDGLRGHLTGFGVPEYVVTTRLGKIPAARPRLNRVDGGYEAEDHHRRILRIGERGWH
jgi:lysine 2,3-aminomutase